MGFTNLIFLFFIIPIFLFIYYLAPSRKRNLVLFLASFLILFWNTPILSFIMVAISCVNFVLCCFMYRLYFAKNKRKHVCLMLVIMNVGALILFLFFGLDSLIYFPQKLISKVMVSLFVFSNISYILDIYRKKCLLQRNLIDFLTYIFAFPKLFAGPLVQYSNMEYQLKNRKLRLQNISDGMVIFVIGLAKKCILADSVNEAQKFVLYQTINNISVGTAWLGAILEFFYLYFYFYGYANMARGLGKMIGFEFPSNFRAILASNSVTNFLERWNISLLLWIRTYIRVHFCSSKLYIKLLSIFFGGLVYALFFGIGFNELLASLYFVLLLIFERIFIFDILVKLPQWLRRIYTFGLVLIGTVLFWQNSINESLKYIAVMFGNNGVFLDRFFVFFVTSFVFILFLCCLFSTNFVRNKMVKLRKKYNFIYCLGKYIFTVILFIISIVFCVAKVNLS